MDTSKVPRKRKMFSKNEERISSSGRQIKTPKNVLSTSDEEPLLKKTKTSLSLNAKLDKLNRLADQLKLKKAATLPQSNKCASGADSGKTTPKENKSVAPGGYSRIMPEENESAANGRFSQNKPNENDSAACADRGKTRPKEDKSAAPGSSSKTMPKGNESAANGNFSKTSSHKSVQSKTSQSDSDETNQIEMTEQFKKKSDLVNASVPPSSVLKTQESVELFVNSSQTDPFNGTDFSDPELSGVILTLPVTNIPNGTSDDFGKMLEKLQVIETKVDILQNKCDQVSNQNIEILQILRARNNNGQLSNKLYQNLEGYPINTIEQFDHLEMSSNKPERQKVYDHLLQLGGLSLKEFLSTGVRQIMSDTLVLSYTWNKQKESKQFGNTRVSNIFYQAAVDCPLFAGPENKSKYKEALLAVFKATKQRCRKHLKKNNEKQVSELEEEVDETIANISSLLESEVGGSEGDGEFDSTSNVGESSSSNGEDENFS